MVQDRIKYPIGEQDFKSLIECGFVYVDKTQYVYELTHSNKYYFLSRPRRFGKSLLISTLRYYFEGKKELFEGLAIEKLETEWKRHPVLLLELSRIDSEREGSLESALEQQLSIWEDNLGITKRNLQYSQRFANVIIESHKTTGEKAVILVDEYDNPLVNTLHNEEVHLRNKELLKSVYSNIKALGEHIQFAMLTGVSRFSHMSIFSGLNNLKDISLDDVYGAVCGITFEEILTYLQEGIYKLSEEINLDTDSTLLELKKYYDGYHFSKRCPDIYNPYSLLNAFQDKELGSYWMRTATPTFLVKRLIDEKVDLNEIFNSHNHCGTIDCRFYLPLLITI